MESAPGRWSSPPPQTQTHLGGSCAPPSPVLVNLRRFSYVESLVQPAQSPTSRQHCAPLQVEQRPSPATFACLHGLLHCRRLLHINTAHVCSSVQSTTCLCIGVRFTHTKTHTCLCEVHITSQCSALAATQRRPHIGLSQCSNGCRPLSIAPPAACDRRWNPPFICE